MKKLSLNVMISFLSQLAAFGYGLVIPRLILGKYGSEVNGLTQSITQFLGVIHVLDMGLGQVVCSSLYAPLAGKDFPQVSRILASCRKFYTRIGLVLGAYVAVLMVCYPSLTSGSFSWCYTAGLILVISLNSFIQYFFGISHELLLCADQKNYISGILQIFCSTVSLAVCLLLLRKDVPIHVIRLAGALVYLSKPVFYSIYVGRHYPIRRKIRYSREPISQKWEGIAQHISAVVLDGTDSIVLTLLAGFSQVSVYSVYYMVISGIQGFYSAAAGGIQSAAGAAWARKDPAEIRTLAEGVEAALHLAVVFLFSCTAILILPFVQVYTSGLTDADYLQPVFSWLLVLACGIRSLRTPYNIWILAAGHFRQTRSCHIAAAVMNLTISVAAVSRLGLTGVAVGTLAAMCCQTLWLAAYTARHLIPWGAGHFMRICLADLTAAGLIRFSTAGMFLREVSWLAWLGLSLQVGLTALICTAVTGLLFYGEKLRNLRKI